MSIRTTLPRRVARYAYHALVGPMPPDPVRAWSGTVAPGIPFVRVLHVGDCGLRQMEAGHDFRAPVGFPRAAADFLLGHGLGMEFSHYFADRYAELPDMEKLRRISRLSGDPDVIVVQLGGSYCRRVIVPDTHSIMRLRVDLARRIGRRVFGVYRVVRPLVRRFGRHTKPYHGTGDLERFLRDLRREWPDADVVLLQPFPRSFAYPTAIPIAERTAADQHELAQRLGIAELDLRDLIGTDPQLHGANGYNLNARGSQLVGEALARWIAEGRAEHTAAAANGTRRFAAVDAATDAVR